MVATALANSLWYQLLPHQRRVVCRMLEPNRRGLVVAHGLGSGKTLTSIATQEALGIEADIVVPASLLKNYQAQVQRWAPGSKLKRNYFSLQACARDYHLAGTIWAPLVIIDEGHRGKNHLSATTRRIFGSHRDDQKRMVLTATPFYDHPSDIAPLIETIDTGDDYVMEGDSFNAYIEETIVPVGWWQRLAHDAYDGVEYHLRQCLAEDLRQRFSHTVDYHANNTEGFPRVSRTTVKVAMTEAQQREHDRLRGLAPPWVNGIVDSGLQPSRRDAAKLDAFLTASRQACDCYRNESSKFDTAARMLQTTLLGNPRAKVVVYSKFITAGLDPYRQRLDALGIQYVSFTGKESKTARDQAVQRYNQGKVRVLIVSSAGGEGLDLVGTRVMQVLDGHFNQAKLDQVEGRAVRYGSHAHLPEAEREVEVQSFISANRNGKGLSSDEHLAVMCAKKEQLLNEFRALLPSE